MTAFRSKRTIVLLVTAAVVITLLGLYVRRQLAIDRCLVTAVVGITRRTNAMNEMIVRVQFVRALSHRPTRAI